MIANFYFTAQVSSATERNHRELQRPLLQSTGINFEFNAQSELEYVETLSGSTPDTTRYSGKDVERTDYYAIGFSFDYKGHEISGALPRTYAGFDAEMDYKFEDLLPAVTKACGFPLDLNEVGRC